jgi:hypothetical protein
VGFLGLFNCLSVASCVRRQPSRIIVEALARWRGVAEVGASPERHWFKNGDSPLRGVEYRKR